MSEKSKKESVKPLKGLIEKVKSLPEDDFLVLYADMTKRMRLLKGSPSSNLSEGDRIVLQPKGEGDIPATVTEVTAHGFQALTDDGIIAHVSPSCKYRKMDPPKEGDEVTLHTSEGDVKATLLKRMGSVCRVLQSGNAEPRTVPAAQVGGLVT